MGTGDLPLISGYQLVEELGRGGMGVVYRARHVATGAERAFKVLLGTPDTELVARFRREAEALARAAGDGVVPVHEVGVDRGRLWFVMGLMTGRSLRDRLHAAGRLDWKEAVGIVAHMARALERCHKVGLVHRDLKPENVLFDDEGKPRIADFGCVRDSHAASLTETGAILGTPVYMAPEQLMGVKADARADVFSLGAILFELVTGERPYRTSRSLVEILEDRRSAPPPRARARAPEVPAALDDAIAKSLAAEPEDRQPSAGAFSRELEAIRDGRAAGSGLSPVAKEAVAAVVAGLLLLGVLGVVHRSSKETPPPPEPARLVVANPPVPPLSPPRVPTPADDGFERFLRSLEKGEGDAAAVVPLGSTEARRGRLVAAALKGAEEIALRAFLAKGDRFRQAIDLVDAAWRLNRNIAPGPNLVKLARDIGDEGDPSLPIRARATVATIEPSQVEGCLAQAMDYCDGPTETPPEEKIPLASLLLPCVERAAQKAPPAAKRAKARLRWFRAVAGDWRGALDGLGPALEEAREDPRVCGLVVEAITRYTRAEPDTAVETEWRSAVDATIEASPKIGWIRYVRAQFYMARFFHEEVAKDRPNPRYLQAQAADLRILLADVVAMRDTVPEDDGGACTRMQRSLLFVKQPDALIPEAERLGASAELRGLLYLQKGDKERAIERLPEERATIEQTDAPRLPELAEKLMRKYLPVPWEK